MDLGIGLVMVGLVLGSLVWALLRLFPNRASIGQDENIALVLPDFNKSSEAVLVVQAGGRVEFINPRAREWFGLQNDDVADIERLARRVRPPEEFLEVCATPGQRRVNVNGRLAELTSYQVPAPNPKMLVALHGMELTPALTAQESDVSSSILKVVSDFGQSIASSLELETILGAILENLNRLIPADLLEIKVWDKDIQAFSSYHLQTEDDSKRKLARISQSQFGSFSDRVIRGRDLLLITDVRSFSAQEGQAGFSAMQSYLGAPLVAGGELIGLIEAGQTSGAAFTQQDLNLMRLVSSQVAVALRNSLLYEEEQRRSTELIGLVNLAQTAGSIQDPKDLFTRLVDSVAPLFDADIIGFLLYDEGKHILEGQVPFRGLPPHIVEIYRAAIAPGGPAESLLVDRQPIFTMDASQDESWKLLGLTDIAVAASLRDSALMPLQIGGSIVGYFQVSHHRRGPRPFSDSELRLMNIISNQAAAIIENSVLIQQSRLQTQRSDVLRRMVGLTVSSNALDEILQYCVQELTNLFHADIGAVFLADDVRGQLRLHRGSVIGAGNEVLEALTAFEAQDADYHSITSRQPFFTGRLSLDPRALSIYAPLSQTLRMESLMSIPLFTREELLGELILGSSATDFFSDSDLQVASTAAGQLSSAIENLKAGSQSDQLLREQLDQFITLTRVGRELSASLDLNQLMEVLCEEAVRSLSADCGRLVLLDPDAPAGDPRATRSSGCSSAGAGLSPFEKSAIEKAQSFFVSDFDQQGFFPPHEGVRSALVVPLIHQKRLVGLLQLHSKQPAHFDARALEFIETLVFQTASALINAWTYQGELQRAEVFRRRADTLVQLSNASYVINPEVSLEESLRVIAQGVRDSTPFQVVLVSMYEPDGGLLRRVVGLGIPQETLNELLARKQPYSSLLQLMRPEFKISRSYYIPANQTPVLPPEVHYVYAPHYSQDQSSRNAWDPDDFLLIPLEDAQGNPLGLISLDEPSDGLRPDRATIDSLEVFAAQAALVIGNARRYNELKDRIDSLSSGLQRQQRLLNVTQKDLPVLLRKDLEQTISLHNLDRRAQRVRAGLAITESVSRQLDASSALMALGRETLTQLAMTTALVAENAPEGPRLLHVLGNVPKTTNPEALFGQRNPLRAVLQGNEPILIPNLDESNEWRDVPLLSQLRAKSIICLPVIVENKPVAAVLAVSSEPMPDFTEEDRQVYYQISRQTSIILQNISLLNETRRRLQAVDLLLDFSRRLSGLDPASIIRALLDSGRRVLPAAHAGVVLMYHEQSNLLLPQAVSGYADNESMLQISYRVGEALPGLIFSEKKPRRVDEIDFPHDYALSSEKLGLYRDATGGRLPVSSLFIPILTGDQMLGILVLDNFNTPSAFQVEDENLMISLSQQVALSLENVRLVHAMTERAGQLQALNDVATAMTSSLRSEELIASLLQQLVPVLPFDTATLWLRERERLAVAAVHGFPDAERRLGLTVAVADSALFKEMVKSNQPISVPDVREDPRFPAVEAPHLSWLGVPLISKGELIGVIALEKWQSYFYTREQIQLASTFAGQAAAALDNSKLLEESLSRAADLDQRSQRLGLLNRFSSALSGLLDSDQILSLSAEELRKALNVDRTSAVSFEHDQAVWKVVSPESRHDLPQVLPDAPLFERLRESLGIFNTENVTAEPDLQPIMGLVGKGTKALLVLPLVSGQNLRALLFAHITGQGRFTATEIELARTITNQAAIALENARLYQSTVRTAERFSILNRASADIGSSLDPEEIYAAIHKAVGRLMPVEAFEISLLDEESQVVEGVYLIDRDVRLPNTHAPLGEGLSSRVIMTGQPLNLVNAQQAAELRTAAVGMGRGSPMSILAVPLMLGGKTIGMLSAQSYQVNVYTGDDLQLLSTLANQAVVAIQNGRLFAETQRLAQELEQRVIERTAQLKREQQNTETLLRILTEVSSSLDLDRALNRTLSLLNDAIGAEQGTIMLLHPDDNLLHYRAGYGYLSERAEQGGRGFTLKVGEGLAGWVVQNREAAMIDDLRLDRRWVQSQSTSREHRSTIVAPLLVAEDVIGVLMVFHREERFFTPDALNLVKAIASQVAVAINNAHLYELIRDQAERLGLMLRKEQEEASRSQAILEAVADGVLVTGPNNRITFLNSSIQKILDINAGRVIDQPLEDFGGLFGKASSSWMETIRNWSQSPSSYQSGDTYAEQLELGDGRIALIHLAPVILQNDFLGTVSIFRDITHEVEVDRLKSEFVATVSHELRTPMTAIKGYVDVLLMGAAGAVNENQSHFLNIVKNNIDRLNILVNDLLDISRIEAGRVILTPQPLDLREIAEDVIGDVLRRSQEEGKPMALSLEAPKTLPRVIGDAERVRQVIDNLVDNAYHYTPENGTIKVSIRAVDGTEVQVDVEDDGVGIAPSDQERVFERFYRGEHPLVLATPGTGLGLPIVRQLVEMHNGRIWMKSEGLPGKGSVFSFTLPIQKDK
ncbi:MAG TPA: GAF domain-containing protein [Anaerolineales bacterium]|nr:GAF domain-containing protein [Anaerolineales bacterium]